MNEISSLDDETKTEIVHSIIDMQYMNECELLGCLGVTDENVVKIKDEAMTFFEDPWFLYDCVGHVRIEDIQSYLNEYQKNH